MARPAAALTPTRPRTTSLSHAAWVIALAAGIALRVVLPQPAQRTPDEEAYAIGGAVLHRDGIAAEARMVAAYAADPLMAELPPPTRIALPWLGAVAMSLTGSTDVGVVASISTLGSALQLAVLAALALEALGPWGAALAIAFLAASPLDLAIARRAWADSLLGLVATLMLWAFTRAAARPGGRAWPATVIALGAGATLVKEAGLLLLGLGAAGLAVVEWRAPGGPRRALLMLLGGVAGAAAAAGALTLLCGGIAPWRAALEHMARGVEANDYVRRYQTGSGLYYARGLALLQPLPWLLGIAGAVVIATRGAWAAAGRPRGSGAPKPARGGRPGRDRKRAAVVLGASAWFALIGLGAACLYRQKNLRFLSPIYAAVALLAAATVRAGLARLRARLPAGIARRATAGVAILLVASLGMDLLRFQEQFVRRDVLDLVTPWLEGRLAPPASGGPPAPAPR